MWIYRRRPERLCFYQKQEKETEAEALIWCRRPADGLRPADLWWSGWCWRPKSWWTALWLRSSPAGRSWALLFLHRRETDALARTESLTRTRLQQEGKRDEKGFLCRSSPQIDTETKDAEEIHFHDCSLIKKHKSLYLCSCMLFVNVNTSGCCSLHWCISTHTWDRGWTDVLSYLHFFTFILFSFVFLLLFVLEMKLWVKSKQMFFCCSLIWTACFVWLTLYITYNIWSHNNLSLCEWIQSLPGSSDDLVHVTVKELNVCRCVCTLTWVDAAAGVICVEIWSAWITNTLDELLPEIIQEGFKFQMSNKVSTVYDMKSFYWSFFINDHIYMFVLKIKD